MLLHLFDGLLRDTRDTYPEVLDGSVLVLLAERPRRCAGKVSGGGEDDAGSQDAVHGVEEDLGVLARRRSGTGTVRAEGDPVC
jgi:hypothetical protein